MAGPPEVVGALAAWSHRWDRGVVPGSNASLRIHHSTVPCAASHDAAAVSMRAGGCHFRLHPLHVESVAWVAERKDVLST
jgi:hypothetical protein